MLLLLLLLLREVRHGIPMVEKLLVLVLGLMLLLLLLLHAGQLVVMHSCKLNETIRLFSSWERKAVEGVRQFRTKWFKFFRIFTGHRGFEVL